MDRFRGMSDEEVVEIQNAIISNFANFSNDDDRVTGLRRIIPSTEGIQVNVYKLMI